jgi:hypothetical protein
LARDGVVADIQVVQQRGGDVTAKTDHGIRIATGERNQLGIGALVKPVRVDHPTHAVEIPERECVAIKRSDGKIPHLGVPQAEESNLPFEAEDVNRFPLIFLFDVFAVCRQAARCHHCPGVEGAASERDCRDFGDAFPWIAVAHAQRHLLERARIEAGLSFEPGQLGGDLGQLGRILGQKFRQCFIDHAFDIDDGDRVRWRQ